MKTTATEESKVQIITVATKSGNEVHASIQGFMGRTLCGSRPSGKVEGNITCERCQREAERLAG